MLPKEDIVKELFYRTSRSSGSGGQNVNKVETRVEAVFNVVDSNILTESQKSTLQTKLARKITSDGELIVSSSESRSQFKNKEIATEKLLNLLENGLKKLPKRKPTSIPKSVKEKRLKDKRIQAEKKDRRNFNP